MSVTARFKVNSGYVLYPRDACKLWQVMEEKFGAVKVVALCADDIEREFKDSSALGNYDNFPDRKMRSMDFMAQTENYTSHATVRFNQRYAPYIELNARGEEDDVARLKEHVANLAQAIKPWYSGLSKVEFLYVVLGVVVVLAAILGATTGNSPSKPSSLKVAVIATLLLIVAIAILAGLTWLLNFLRAKFFPIGTFAFGAEERRYQFQENIRWVVFIGFLVSLFAAVIFALIWR